MSVIWLASYPKSGNTWIRTLLREYFRALEGRVPFETNDTATYWYQAVSPKPISTLEVGDAVMLRSAAMSHLMTFTTGYNRQYPATVIKTHLPNAIQGGLPYFNPMWCEKAVYIYRDPRDILPSFASHMGLSLEDAAYTMGHENAALGEGLRLITPLATWSTHVESWLDSENVEVLPIGYEDIHKSPETALKRVLYFYGFSPDREAVEKAVEASQFDVLQARERSEGFHESSKKNDDLFFRRGIVGSHKDEVPEGIVRKIETDHADVLERLGYE